jgi:hypothetical protein
VYDHNLVLTCDLSTLSSLQLLFLSVLAYKLDFPNTDNWAKNCSCTSGSIWVMSFFCTWIDICYHGIQVARSSSLYNVCLMLLVQVSSFVYTPKQKKVRLNLTRRNVLFRDKFKCQYVVLPLTFSVPPSFFQCDLPSSILNILLSLLLRYRLPTVCLSFDVIQQVC